MWQVKNLQSQGYGNRVSLSQSLQEGAMYKDDFPHAHPP